jgi:hypothetical protein
MMNRQRWSSYLPADVIKPSGPEQEQMAHFQRLITRFGASYGLRTARWLPVFAALAVMAAPDTAEAARRGSRAVRAYDGIWNVVFATTRGNCSSGYRVPFTVIGRRVSSAGGGRVSGSVSRTGAVAVSVSVGASRASGGGRLVGSYGAGRWRGIITGDYCSGTWQATRG